MIRILTALAVATFAVQGTASARVSYGGGHHTHSHGGSYGVSGSSHRGGHYTSRTGSHHYGSHRH